MAVMVMDYHVSPSEVDAMTPSDLLWWVNRFSILNRERAA